ncbi:MAG: exopolysaccharide biosynthesis polyprenyl glycosylphosphotransferase [Planctomycetota bacterium]
MATSSVNALDAPTWVHVPREKSGHLTGRLSPLWRRSGQSLVALPPATWMLLDITLVCSGALVAYGVLTPPDLVETPHVALWQAMAVFAFSVTVASLIFGLYERDTNRSRSRILTRMLLTVATAIAITYAMIYVLMYSTVSRRITGLSFGLFFVVGGTVRWLACWAAFRVSRGLLVVGSPSLFRSFEVAKEKGFLPEYKLIGRVGSSESGPGANDSEIASQSFIQQQIPRLVVEGVTDIVVSAEPATERRMMDWLVPCLRQGCRVTNEAIFYEKAAGQILVDRITPTWFLFADLRGHCEEHATPKRVVDLIVASCGLVFTAPVWLVLALLIKLSDGHSVFYSQQRVGQHERPFTLYKFRTMKPNAENGQSIWSTPGDPRVTRIGRWLRKLRLDELPQLYNVLRGDMSIVGPRPERPDLVRELSIQIPYYSERHLVKPGITGWAQISFRYGSSVEDAKQKLQFDMYYLKHMSFELDMIILFRTVGTFLRGGL